MNNKIYCEFACNKGEIYEVVDGITMNDEYSETLDSVSIVLDNIGQTRRLSTIEPYTYVRIYGTGDFAFSKIMLVDNYVETEKNVISHIYSYTISLMSELKLLEKCQCPNIAITHSLVSERKTIYYYISKYMELYSQKAKMASSSGYVLKNIFSVPNENTKFYDKFNVPCADMSMNCPTLRQVITNLMLQVGCIPTMQKGTLWFLDFDLNNATPFQVDSSITKITKSMSSDSFVNSLSYIGEQVLDSGNEVISERLGFRDRDNALLKQTSNLYLNTAFPIYKVDSLKIMIQGDRVRLCSRRITGKWNAYVSNIQWSTHGNYDRWTINVLGGSSSSTIKNFRIHLVKGIVNIPTATPVLTEFKTYYVDGWSLSETETEGSNSISAGETKTIIIDDATYASHGSGSPGYSIWVEFYSTNDLYGSEYCLIAPSLATTYGNPLDIYLNNISNSARAVSAIDITPLCVENSKRSQLEVDFNAMEEEDTIEDLANYYYGTVGYSIGSNKISGFSQTYSKAVGWWSKTKTYIENIIGVIKNTMQDQEGYGNYLTAKIDDAESTAIGNYPAGYAAIPYDGLDISDFGSLTFELKYQPLNEFNMTFLKDSDNPIRIAQYDSANGGVQDFDRLNANMKDKTNRLGNDVLVIMQTTDNISKVRDILDGIVEYDGYQIFKRTISIRNNRISATYYASKGYVMQNYFTAITTKYRAYENVDYSSSVKRRENLSRYIFITESQHSLLKTSETTKLNSDFNANNLLSGLTNQSQDSKVKYAVEISQASVSSYYTNELSVISSKDKIAFAYNCFDNAMAGIRLKTVSADSDLGGIEQQWLKLSDSYSEYHVTRFVSDIPFNRTLLEANDDRISLPDVSHYQDYMTTEFSAYEYYYKDASEVLSLMVQFELYTDSNNIEWTDALLENCKFIARNDYYPNMVSVNRTDELSSEEREIVLDSSQYTDVDPSKVFVFGTDGSITIKWYWFSDDVTSLRISHWEPVDGATSKYDRKVIDYAEFKRKVGAYTQKFYCYINDCKSLKVLTRDLNGLLYVSSTI